MIIKPTQAGYTLIEVVVVMAVIGLLTLSLVFGAGRHGKNERYSGEVNDFANTLREAQTRSYSIETGNCSAFGRANSHARGTVLEYSLGGGTYSMYLLCGQDLSPLAGVNHDQTGGIVGKVLYKTYNLNGLILDQITAGIVSDNVSVAFLAPDGRAYYCLASCDPSSTNTSPYQLNQQDVNFTISYEGVNLRRQVTLETISGMIKTSDAQ